MSDKTLGQVALEAYEAAQFQRGVGEWEAAAQAVVAAGLDHMSDTVEADRLLPTEHKVIEAAEAALPDLRGHVARHFELFGTSNPHYKSPLRNLLEAVEALQEARDGSIKIKWDDDDQPEDDDFLRNDGKYYHDARED